MKKIIAALLLLLPFAVLAQNFPSQLIASGAYTATTVSSGDRDNLQWKGLHVVINVTAYTSGNYTPHIQGKDPVSGVYYDLLVGSAISGIGTTVLKVYPGIATAANGAASDFLPKTWRVTMSGASTPSMTFSVGASLEN